MKKFLQKKLNNEKGMTLIELLAVIVIIAIIAAIAIPAIGNIIENSRYGAVKSDATNALAAANLYFSENPEDTDNTVSIADLSADYLDNAGSLDSATGDATANFISKTATGLEITTGAITYSGSKTVSFSAASVEEINADNANQKGSDEGDKTVPETVAGG